jgi:hypothetical protein
MEKYGNYTFNILEDKKGNGWYYKIYTQSFGHGWWLFKKSGEFFESKNRARFAAIGHICLIEKAYNDPWTNMVSKV